MLCWCLIPAAGAVALAGIVAPTRTQLRLLRLACALQSLQDGSAKYDFIEVMACPGGCIGGGGQPRSADKGILAVRVPAAVLSPSQLPCLMLEGMLFAMQIGSLQLGMQHA